MIKPQVGHSYKVEFVKHPSWYGEPKDGERSKVVATVVYTIHDEKGAKNFHRVMEEYATYFFDANEPRIHDLGEDEIDSYYIAELRRLGSEWPERIDHYAGVMPVGDVVVYSRHRDSSELENWNFERYWDALKKFEPYVRIIHLSHWAAGWIEYILVSQFTPAEQLAQIVDIVSEFETMGVIDEDGYYEHIHERMMEVWESEATLSDKIEWIKDAIRNGELPPFPDDLDLDDEDAVMKWFEEETQGEMPFTILDYLREWVEG